MFSALETGAFQQAGPATCSRRGVASIAPSVPDTQTALCDVSGNTDACTDPNCYAAKLDAHVKAKVAAKPELVQISTAYKQQPEGERPSRATSTSKSGGEADTPEKAKWPEFKTCKYITEAIGRTASTRRIAEGLHRANCPVHHPRNRPEGRCQLQSRSEKRRREEALANATGIRVLQSIVAAVPVRLMKRDLLFVAEQLSLCWTKAAGDGRTESEHQG